MIKLVLIKDDMYVICQEQNKFQLTDNLERATVYYSYTDALNAGTNMGLDKYCIKEL